MSFVLEAERWARQQFGACQLGDQRRTKRAVEFAAQIAVDPSGSTPRQTQSWSDCKAAYRLLDCPDVTFSALVTPHCETTRARTGGHWLLLGDTTEVEFGIQRRVEGLGPTGDGGGRGFFLHTSLMVAADRAEVAGLTGQELFYRQPRPAGESRYDRVLRKRESEVWGRVIDAVGPPPPGTQLTHVFDRGADNFEVPVHLVQQQADWVIRGSQLHRQIVTPDGQSQKLSAYLASLPSAGEYEVSVPRQKNQPARQARVEVRFGLVLMPAPKHRSPWLKATGIQTIAQWVVEVREPRPPQGAQPLRWVLYTSHAVTTFDEAWRVIGYYESRWLIEEYHKSLKTGCRVEERQYQTAERLEAITGILSLVAVRLIQLKMAARHEPERPAAEVVPPLWIEVLQALRRQTGRRWTSRDFYRHLAGLGGFLGRKSDGDPGWMTLWRGFEKLAPALRYAEHQQKCG